MKIPSSGFWVGVAWVAGGIFLRRTAFALALPGLMPGREGGAPLITWQFHEHLYRDLGAAFVMIGAIWCAAALMEWVLRRCGVYQPKTVPPADAFLMARTIGVLLAGLTLVLGYFLCWYPIRTITCTRWHI